MDKKESTKPFLIGSNYSAAEASPGFLFWKVFNRWARLLRTDLEKIGVTQAQYSILTAVSYLGSTGDNVAQQDVSNQLSMDKMMVSDVVKTLERKKYLKRSPHPSDGRAMALYLTYQGKKVLENAVPIVEAVDEKFFGSLTCDQEKLFKKLLAQLGGFR